MGLDGGGNSLVEVNSYAEPMGEANRFGNGFYAEETVIATEPAAGPAPKRTEAGASSTPTNSTLSASPSAIAFIPRIA